MTAEVSACIALLAIVGIVLAAWVYVLNSRLTKLEVEVRFLRMDLDTMPYSGWATGPKHFNCDCQSVISAEEADDDD